MYSVERVITKDRLLELQKPWRALAEEVDDLPLFLTWEWIYTWWSNYEHTGDLWILCVRDEQLRLVAVAPWILMPKKLGPLTLRKICFIFYRPPVHMDLIVKEKDMERACVTIESYLMNHQQEWDILELKGVRKDSALLNLSKAAGQHLQRNPIISPRITLPDEWDLFIKHTLSYNQRKSLRYYERRLMKEYPGKVSFEMVTQPDEVNKAMKTLFQLNKRRWHEKGYSSIFDDLNFQNFNLEIAKEALKKGWLRLHQLKVSETVIATDLIFRYRNILYGYQTAFDPDWSRFSPGQVLLGHTVKEGINEKAQFMDLLRGQHDYKLSWTDHEVRDLHILFSRSMPGHCWLLTSKMYDQGLIVGNVLPAGFREEVNRILSKMNGR